MGCACKYEHRCDVKACNKLGHGAHICRIRLAQEQKGSNVTSGESVSVKK